MIEPEAYVCTLTARELPERVQQVEALRRGLLTRERDGREVRLRFEPDLADLTRAFVRDESDCCSFYDLTVERTETAVILTVRAPAGAETLLASLFDAFDPDRSSSS